MMLNSQYLGKLRVLSSSNEFGWDLEFEESFFSLQGPDSSIMNPVRVVCSSFKLAESVQHLFSRLYHI